ncbi:MAG: GNAT family N-acetyltransferase [Devosia sp.]
MSDPEIVFDDHPPEDWIERVGGGVDRHNIAFTGIAEWHLVRIFLKSTDGDCVGGLLGSIWGDWLEVDSLWVDEAWRGRGYATQLLAEAERFATQKGCSAATLDTHNPDALRLYQKLGYEVFGVLDDYPPGWNKSYLRKRFA